MATSRPTDKREAWERDPRLAKAREPLPTPVIIGIVAGVAGLILLISGLVWWGIGKKLLPWPLVLLILGVAGVAAYVVTNRRQLADFWRVRSSRQIVNSAAFALFVLGIVVLINIIGARHRWRHDFSESKQYTLAEQTLKILRELDKPVELIAFVSPDYYNAEEIRSRLREYDIASPKLKVTIYDPKTNFDKVKEYGIQFDGTIIVKCGDKKEEVTGGSEEQITSAILAVSSGEKNKVYFLAGHGEKPLDSYEDDGLASLKRNLENQQYEAKELVLMKEKEPKVPADCDVLCIIGPQRKLFPKEVDAIKKYLEQGGCALICVEPPPAPSLNEILEAHGVKALDGEVIDPVTNLWGQWAIPLVVRPESHEITRNLPSLFFPTARALEVEEEESEPSYPGGPPPPPKKKGVELLLTSDSAWLETNLQPGKPPVKDPGERSGRLCLAVAVDEGKKEEKPPWAKDEEEESEGPSTRLVVVGDADFLTQRIARLTDVGLFFGLKSIAWLAKQKKLVSIPPKEKKDYRLVVSGNQLKLVIILIFLVPVLVLLAGVGVWLLRRGG